MNLRFSGKELQTLQLCELIVCVCLQGWCCPCLWSCCWQFSTSCWKCGGCGWRLALNLPSLSHRMPSLSPPAAPAAPSWTTLPQNPLWPPSSQTLHLQTPITGLSPCEIHQGWSEHSLFWYISVQNTDHGIIDTRKQIAVSGCGVF